MTFQDELDAERYYGEQLGREKERRRFQAELAEERRVNAELAEERRVNAELARALNEAGRDGELTGAFLDDNKRAELIREFGLEQR